MMQDPQQRKYPKDQSSLNLPNLKFYYWASQLNRLVEWLKQDKETNWRDLEKSSPQVPLVSLPFLGQKRWNKLKLKNEWMKCTQKTWFTVKKK